MGRPLRIFEPGAFYHLTSRGNNGEAIVRDDLDCLDFLRWLSRIVSEQKWRVVAYCLIRLLAKWWKGIWDALCRPRAVFRAASPPRGKGAAGRVNPGSVCRDSAKTRHRRSARAKQG
jgi:hypothetical protein